MGTITPYYLTHKIINFCKNINPDSSPIYISVINIPGMMQNDCFINVQKYIENYGGMEVIGRTIWYWEGIMLEAELHSIVKTKANELIDVTPTSEKQILFLPDPSTTFNGVDVIPNIREPFRVFPELTEFIELTIEKNRYMNSGKFHGVFGEVPLEGIDADYIASIENSLTILGNLIEKRRYTSDDLCFCGSNIKFKKCCWRKI